MKPIYHLIALVVAPLILPILALLGMLALCGGFQALIWLAAFIPPS